MSKKTTLQKFTNYKLTESLPTKIENLIKQIIEVGKLHPYDIWNLTDEEKKILAAILTTGTLILRDDDRDKYLENIEPVLSESSRNEIWEQNHQRILNVISYQVTHDGRIPTVTSIAEETGLSRATITKHLKEYYDSNAYKERELSYKFLREKLIGKIYGLAYYGDMRAAKLFLEYTGGNELQGNTYNTQNNYIQVNEFRITQEAVQRLSPEQINVIEDVLKEVLPQK
jgi:predicted transcriptional regulator